MCNEKLEMDFLKVLEGCGELADINVNNEKSKKFVVREIQKLYKQVSLLEPSKVNLLYKTLLNKTGRGIDYSIGSEDTREVINKRLFIVEIWVRESIYETFVVQSFNLNQELKISPNKDDLETKLEMYGELNKMIDDSYANLSSIMYRFRKIIEEY